MNPRAPALSLLSRHTTAYQAGLRGGGTQMRMVETVLATGLLGLACLSASAQAPLVYDVENTGANYAAPVFPDFPVLPIVRQLPDPYVYFDGTRDTSFAGFERHRNEWKHAMEQYEIGTRPDCSDCVI